MNNNTIKLLNKHFEIALESPDGIKKLRELILTLAMQGKLVKQDPKDQPASELLKEIEIEKNRLIKEGKIKKQKELPPIKPEEVPYEVPKGWVWTRLGKIYSFEYGDNLPSEKRSNTGEFPVYGSNGIVGTHNKTIVNNNCIVIGRKGSAGALNLCLSNGCWVTDVSYSCVPPKNIDILFTLNLFKNLKLDELGKGIKPGLNRNEAYIALIPIPPLAEQKRIVAKIDELMSLCDKLEAQRKTRNDKRLAVHTSAINRLLTATNTNDFDTSWQFITCHFDQLYSVKENVTELKKAILTLAMKGKLVKQDPKDQSASELLKEIKAEEKRLIKEGKIKKQKELPPIKQEEVPYELPQGWKPVRLGEIGFWKSGSTPSRTNHNYYGGDIPWVKSGEVKQGRISNTEEYITEEALKTCALSINEKGSVLVAMYGANIGEVGILDIPATTNQAVCACKTYKQFDESYLLHLIHL